MCWCAYGTRAGGMVICKVPWVSVSGERRDIDKIHLEMESEARSG